MAGVVGMMANSPFVQVVDREALGRLALVNQDLVDLNAQSTLTHAQEGAKRALTNDFIEYTRQALGLPTIPTGRL